MSTIIEENRLATRCNVRAVVVLEEAMLHFDGALTALGNDFSS